jgi:folate-dependent tRNA-U54 methylase TrmFO/GidA
MDFFGKLYPMYRVRMTRLADDICTGNKDRERRCNDLIQKMEEAERRIANAVDLFDDKMEFYQQTVLDAAQANGFPTLAALGDDMKSLLDEVDREDVKRYENVELALTDIQSVLQAMGFLCFVAQGVGAIRKKRKFGTNFRKQFRPS